mmetsp:Transcript_162286/g.287565  ORF Transcript_162286/g.287565 Transcript_162286/m.287565 type:complete len:101 (+) Transcript_162286:525-827(+)
MMGSPVGAPCEMMSVAGKDIADTPALSAPNSDGLSLFALDGCSNINLALGHAPCNAWHRARAGASCGKSCNTALKSTKPSLQFGDGAGLSLTQPVNKMQV